MKKPNLVFCMLVMLLTSFAFSVHAAGTPKNTYIITKGAGTDAAIKDEEAIKNADFTEFRLQNKHRLLTFDNGVVIELLSATELKALGYDVNPAAFMVDVPQGYVEPTYSVTDQGALMVFYPPNPSILKK
jgi:hypothetical protein